MTQLVKLNYRVTNALNFRSALSRTTPIADNVYLWFGNNTPWTDENSPPTPLDDISDEFATRAKMIGAKRITLSNTCFVVPRYNWQSGTIYAQYSATDPALASKQFYVLTTDNNVYKCISNNAGVASVIQPTGTSTSAIQTGDGYVWKFMYNLSSNLITDFLTTEWLPVPTDGQKTSYQLTAESNAVYATGSPVGGHSSNAIEELFAVNVMISELLDGSEGGVLPTNSTYRQYGLWKNPKLIAGGTLASGTVYLVNDISSTIDPNTGSILYVENRKLITRSSDQAEKIQFVLIF